MKKLAAIALGIALAGTATVALAGRNSAGSYTLPSGNPVTPGTITRVWANNTLGDIAAEMSNSLDRDGRGGMRAPLRVPNGSAGAPTLSFSNETSSGWYRAALGDLRMSVGGVDRCTVTSSGLTVAGALTASGAASVPSIAVSTGDATFSKTGDQQVVKSGGGLFVGTSDSNLLAFKTNNATAAIIDTAGALNMQSHVIYELGAPTTSTMAATKGYVDGKFPASSWTAVTAINGWLSANAYYWKDSIGVVHLRGNVLAGASPSSGTFAQLPAGYRPGEYFRASISDQVYGPNTLTINTDGTMVVNSYVANTAYNVSSSFVAEN